MIIRKNVKTLKDSEKKDLVDAITSLKRDGTYDQFVLTHNNAAMTPAPWGGDMEDAQRSMAHSGPVFLPWHREFILRFEKALQSVVPEIALPYWKWEDDAGLPNDHPGAVWSDDLVGGDGDPFDNCNVSSGPFSKSNNWNIVCGSGDKDGFLQRCFGKLQPGFQQLPDANDVSYAMGIGTYDQAPWSEASMGSFRNTLEGWIGINKGPPELHNRVHCWVGGSMFPMTSPNDPVFFLHHSNVDRIWAEWQDKYRNLPYMPRSGGPNGHNLNDPMYPWNDHTPGDVLDCRKLGYSYDTQASLIEMRL